MDRTLTSSPWGFRFYDIDKYFEVMKSNFNITANCTMFGDPEIFPLAIAPDEDAVRTVSGIAEAEGATILEIATTGDYENEIPLAAKLGAKYFRFCSVWEDTPQKREWLIETLQKAGKQADEYGIVITLENHGGLLTRASECRKLLEEVGLKNVVLNYDPANFEFYGDDPVAALDEVLPHVGFTHFKSVRCDNDKKTYCRISQGALDYVKIFKKLLPAYDGPIGLEYEEPDDAEAGTADDLNSIYDAIGLVS